MDSSRKDHTDDVDTPDDCLTKEVPQEVFGYHDSRIRNQKEKTITQDHDDRSHGMCHSTGGPVALDQSQELHEPAHKQVPLKTRVQPQTSELSLLKRARFTHYPYNNNGFCVM